ncbi:hypothetical protein AVEN_258925-1 [Araneus ventricosus]|uniref:DUF7041 domain-containing protein n=1 Tax=Araneus ventricosus TaxID=182803 RepID=A0A4Y2CH19_ARAVE|nr:hypothetical protein AVEN_258925-1 [Araneus ventricosus]
MESQFAIAFITITKTKFRKIIASLADNLLSNAIIKSPSNDDSHSAVKMRLINLFPESENARIRTLLSEMLLDCQKPSQLLRKMIQLALDKVSDATVANQHPPDFVHKFGKFTRVRWYSREGFRSF